MAKVNKKSTLKYEGAKVEQKKVSRESYVVFAVFGLIVALVALLTVIPAKKTPVTNPTTSSKKTVNQTYNQATYRGVTGSQLSFDYSTQKYTYQLAEGYHAFNTSAPLYTESSIDRLQAGSLIDVIVSNNQIIAVYHK